MKWTISRNGDGGAKHRPMAKIHLSYPRKETKISVERPKGERGATRVVNFTPAVAARSFRRVSSPSLCRDKIPYRRSLEVSRTIDRGPLDVGLIARLGRNLGVAAVWLHCGIKTGQKVNLQKFEFDKEMFATVN